MKNRLGVKLVALSLITREQLHVESGVASIMSATASCFAVIFVHFLTRDAKIPLHRAIGVLISGAYVLLRPELDGGISSRGLGETAGLCAAVPLALAGIFGKRFHDQLPVVTATGMFTCSSLVMLPLVVIVDRPWTLDISMSSMTPVAGLVLFSSVLTYLPYFSILSCAGATSLLMVTLLMAVSARVLGALSLPSLSMPPLRWGWHLSWLA